MKTISVNSPAVRQRGFTLVEAIVVMVITGVLAGVMVLFIRQPVRNYANASARADMADAADLALRRMVRELHSALPNSVRLTVSGGISLLEFIPTKAGGQYLDVSDNGNASSVPLSFTDANVKTFNVVGPMPAAPYAIAATTDYIVVYNLGPGYAGADAYVGSNRAKVSGVGINSVSLVANPFVPGAGVVANASPGHRFQVVTSPVTFRCTDNVSGGGTLTRYTGYGFNGAQIDPAALPASSGVTGALLAKGVLACSFSVDQAANRHSGLIGLSIALARSGAGTANDLETMTLTHQIHTDNTP
ncbi:type II secretion system protein [Duganella sp. Dugasp56]|uniref:type II secretion system protein n=1 Tax=Duganella sp. Dugasp56 TaxID=3243046 RepID=UPI0039AF1E55